MNYLISLHHQKSGKISGYFERSCEALFKVQKYESQQNSYIMQGIYVKSKRSIDFNKLILLRYLNMKLVF